MVQRQLQYILIGYFKDIFSRSILIYFFSLYFVVSSIQNASQGYDFVPAPIYFIFVQILLVLILLRLLPDKIILPVHVLQVYTAIFLTIPTLVTSFTNSEKIGLFESFGSSFAVLLNQLIIFLLAKLFLKIPTSSERVFDKSRTDKVLILLMLLSVSAVIYILPSLQTISIFGFEEVYDHRVDFMNIVSKPGGSILGYVIGLLGGTLVPLILIWALFRKSYLLAVYSFILAFLVYLGAAQKWVFGSSILVLILFVIDRKRSSLAINSYSAFNGFSFLIWILIILDPILKGFRLVDLGVRRFLLDPSITLQYYLAFSKDYTFRYWQDLTPVQWLLNKAPTAEVPATIIGKRYFYVPEKFYLPTSSKMNATGGAISDSIAQAGILGLIITSCLLFFFFLILGKFCTEIDTWLMFSISALSTYIICEGTIHTSFFSKGLILVPLVLFIHSRQLLTSTKPRQ